MRTAWVPSSPTGAVPGLRLDVLRVVEETLPGGAPVIEVAVEARERGVRDVSGLQSAAPGVTVTPRAIALRAGGVPFGPEVPPERVNGWGAPPSMPYRAWWRLRFPLPPGTSTEALQLEVTVNGRVLVVPLRGPVVDAEGSPGVALVPFGPDNLPASGVPTVSGPDGDVPAVPGWPPVVPEASGPWTVSVPGVGEAVITATSGVEPVRIGAPAAPFTPRVPSADALDASLDMVDDLAAWVRANVRVVPGHGVLRSADAVVRAGEGSPFERAAMLWRWLAARGVKARVACVDLPPEVAAEVFAASAPAVPPAAEALAGALASAPPVPASLLPRGGARSRFALVPAWCWVDREVTEGEPWVPIDLSPDGLDLTPYQERAWSVTNRLADDMWRMQVRVTALLRDGTQVEELVLLERMLQPADLEQIGLVVDLIPEGRGTLRSRDGLLYVDDVALREGRLVAQDRLEAVQVGVWLHDPAGVFAGWTRWTVYDREADGDRLDRWRLVIGSRPHDADGSLLATRLDALGRHPDPGAAWMAAELHRIARDTARWSGPAGEPALWLSWLEVPDGAPARRWIESMWTAASLRSGRGPDVAERAQAAAVDAWLRAEALGVPLPAAPDRWAVSGADFQRLPAPSRRNSAALVRAAETAAIGLGPDGAMWRVDPRTGVPTWVQPAGVEVELAPAGDAPGAIVGAARWATPVRCLIQATWDGVDAAAGCPDQDASAAPPATSGQ